MENDYFKILINGIVLYSDSFNEYLTNHCKNEKLSFEITSKRINELIEQCKQDIFRQFDDKIEEYEFLIEYISDKESITSPLLSDVKMNTSRLTNKEHRIYIYLKDLEKIQPQICKSNQNFKTSKDEIKFDTLIFKDQESYNLFLFLVDDYAVNFKVKQFSQIYHWLIKNDNRIKPNTGAKYIEHVKVNFPLMTAKFSRIEEKNQYEMATLNDVFKRLAHNK